MIRTCVECKFCRVRDQMGGLRPFDGRSFGGNEVLECTHPQAKSRDPLYGRAMCGNERQFSGKKGCGKEGKLWEAK